MFYFQMLSKNYPKTFRWIGSNIICVSLNLDQKSICKDCYYNIQSNLKKQRLHMQYQPKAEGPISEGQQVRKVYSNIDQILYYVSGLPKASQ